MNSEYKKTRKFPPKLIVLVPDDLQDRFDQLQLKDSVYRLKNLAIALIVFRVVTLVFYLFTGGRVVDSNRLVQLIYSDSQIYFPSGFIQLFSNFLFLFFVDFYHKKKNRFITWFLCNTFVIFNIALNTAIISAAGHEIQVLFFFNLTLVLNILLPNLKPKIFIWSSVLFYLATEMLIVQNYTYFYRGDIQFFIFAAFLTILTIKLLYYNNSVRLFIEMNKIEELNETLTKRTEELELSGKEEAKARKLAEEATKAKSLFLANMSHEIRTPMNAIIGMSELLLSENLNERQMQFANNIKDSSSSLLEIINDILDLSKIESSKFELTPVHYDLPLLLKNIHTMLKYIAEKKNIEFLLKIDEDVPQFIYGDDIRLRQILVNICGNGIKFTGHGFVCLNASVKDDLLVFKIEDTGIGIPANELNNIFDAFSQADTSTTRTIKGTGLGLSISKQLAQLMNGSIEVESVYGEGTVFTVTVPKIIGNGKLIKGKELKKKKFTAPSCKILVVDDNEVNLDVAKGFLEMFGIEADTAISGAKAIELVNNQKFDIIFMDHMMPEMDGIETAKKIRERERDTAHPSPLPIIALTANMTSGIKEMFLENGFNDYLSKPLEIGKLTEILLKWLPADKVRDKVRDKTGNEENKNIKEPEKQENEKFTDKIRKINFINADIGMYYFSNMEKMYEKALHVFYKTVKKECESMKKFLDEGNLHDFGVSIHGIKSSLLSVGITELSALAGELERSARAGDLQFCRSHFPPLFEQLIILHDQLAQI